MTDGQNDKNRNKRTVRPGPVKGTAEVPGSKSMAHRLLIAAALSDRPVRIRVEAPSNDVGATADCLRAMGAPIERDGALFSVRPLRENVQEFAELPCGGSGSTLRFLLPVAGALGCGAAFRMEGRLPERPLAPLDGALRAHGMEIERRGDTLLCGGTLLAGEYEIPGNVSSQYISGLLLALPLLAGDSVLRVTGEPESRGYIAMTEEVLRKSGIRFGYDAAERLYTIPGGQRYRLPEEIEAERDWSGAAFFLAMGAFSNAGVTVPGLALRSTQGDRAILEVLSRFGAAVTLSPKSPGFRPAPDPSGDGCVPAESADVTVRRGALRGITVDASDIPDLVPVIAAVAAAAEGETRIVRAERLRLKESDRLETTAAMLRAIGGDVSVTADGLVIRGRKRLRGGTVDPAKDHRIAMAAAVAASACESAVTVLDSGCTDKSFPGFWEELERLEEDA